MVYTPDFFLPNVNRLITYLVSFAYICLKLIVLILLRYIVRLIDISEGVNLFNNAFYFESHDYFEDLWLKAEQEDRLFFQGMVQISVGCYHYDHKNYKGALSQFTRGSEKLKLYGERFNGVNIGKLLSDVKPLKLELEKFFEGEIENPGENNYPVLEYITEKS